MISCHYLLFYSCLLLIVGHHVANAVIRVNYGYFAEASPIRVACARGWFNTEDYQVTCYPQTSGLFVAARLDSGSLHLAELGSTPLAQALARGVDIRVVYIDQYKGESQGIYVRPSDDESGYKGIENPFDLIGKKVGVPFGSTMHYHVLFLLDIFDMTGEVDVLNVSPTEIIKAWDDKTIDAAACWGNAREHVLGGDNPGNVLVTAGVLADWGRETFDVVAVGRDFMNNNAEFVERFVTILGLLTDSFMDNLGEFDGENAKRWIPTDDPLVSYIPSMADTLMKAGEEARNPSIEFINNERRALDLFIQLSTEDQLSCDYLGGGKACGRPSHQHIAMQKTAEFLMDQNVIHSMGQLSVMGDSGIACSAPNTLCGSDIFTGSGLNHDLYSLDSWDGQAPFYALNETGRAGEGEMSTGDSICSRTTLVAKQRTQYFGDLQGENSLVGQSYSDNLDCWWTIRSSDCIESSSFCSRSVELSFLQVRIWSGDYIRVYSDPECDPDSTTKVLLGQITGLDPDLPVFRARGCILVHLETDANQEGSYNDMQNQGDGFAASFTDSIIVEPECNGEQWGADCSFTKHCLGTSHIDIGRDYQHSISSGTSRTYPNDLDCIWEVKAKGDQSYVVLDVEYDLEPTYDYLQLLSGTFGSTSGVTPHAFLSAESTKERYYIPTDKFGFATIRLVTDSLGQRSGFTASVSAGGGAATKFCSTPGTSGLFCDFPHCIVENFIERGMVASPSDVDPEYQIGRVVSQIKSHSVPANIDCAWPLDKTLGEAHGIRLRFNSPLDLEPQPASAVGDKVVVRAGGKVAAEVYVEKCTTDDVCSYSWQTGKCENGACTVHLSLDVEIDDFAGAELHLLTDRTDGGKEYNGVDFDVLFISSCPSGPEVHCEAGSGKCVDGGCVCNDNIPCACPCDADGLVSTMNAALMWVLIPIVFIFISIFVWYRRRKIRKSRAQKAIIQEKEEQLTAFRNSVVGMRTATTHYMPTPSISDSDDDAPLAIPPPLEKIQWCWRETPSFVSAHSPDMIVGNPADCWIKYDHYLNAMLEDAFQAHTNSESKKTSINESFKKLTSMNESFKKLTPFSPAPLDELKFIVCRDGYKVDVRDMKQTKEATGFERDVQRVVEVVDPVPQQAPKDRKEIDLSEVEIGNSLPDELCSEPQMVLVKGDVVQISSQRPDGWAFGTKLQHNDEVTARELVRLTSKGALDSNIFTDTGWFPLDTTEIPTGEELALLQTKVGGTDALQAPSYWDDIDDPTIVQLHKLKQSDKEYDSVIEAFLSTLKLPRFSKKVKVVGIQRIQNLAMWQSYVVKRQTICYRETGGQGGTDSPEVMKRALDRFERHWLWHGTNNDVMDKIMQQGFNRSFCGKNATVYGKGVYFARDAEYSAYPTYAVPDENNVQYMMACRVIVGEYCPGVRDAFTPDIRDPSTQALYDTTVGLLSNDTMADPSIYVTYHDAQAYPEYLIKFETS